VARLHPSQYRPTGDPGIGSIARGALPLTLFGPQGDASLMGKLVMPSLLAQALAPSLGAVMTALRPARTSRCPSVPRIAINLVAVESSRIGVILG
jgi:hypothetical protein